ncbi:MAG: TRAP transporter small permease [Sphaerochaetaceae bacterium]|jgi:TRAP-type C4-dicarboxylate transport system permease small subunit
MNGSKAFATTKTIVEKAIDVLSVVLFIVIFVLGLMQIFWRWVLNDPLAWSEEAIRLIYVWICYLGWVIAERSGGHIKITALIVKAPIEFQKWMQIFNHFVTIVFSILMVVYGVRMMKIASIGHAVSFNLNYSWVYLMVPVCNFLIIVYEILGMIGIFRDGPKPYTIVDEEATE